MQRGLALSALDFVLVTLLLALFGSSPWSWLGGPVSALAIWWIDGAKRERPQEVARPRPARSTISPPAAAELRR
jgi:fatty acid desaturase